VYCVKRIFKYLFKDNEKIKSAVKLRLAFQ